MGLAREFGLPVVVVGDIDRGGILASLYGTWALLDEEDRALLKSFVINKFRGDVDGARAGAGGDHGAAPACRSLGVIPWLLDVWLDSEDTLEVGHWRASTALSATARDRLKVAVVRLPRHLERHRRRRARRRAGRRRARDDRPGRRRAADLVVLPGSRSTATDLAWLRERGLADVVARAGGGRGVRCSASAAATRCSAHEIEDDVEGRVGRRAGLGLLPTRVDVRRRARCSRGRPARGAGTRWTRPTRSTTASRVAARRRTASREAVALRAVPRRLEGRLGLGHDVARRLRERRLPPGLAR